VNAQALPTIKLRPVSGWQALNLRQVWQYRDLVLAFAARDVKLRYRQTVLGVAWVIAQPLIAAGIFSFVFGKIAKLDTGVVPYFVFSYAGMLAWNVFSATLVKTSGCLVQNAGLISKIFFPRLVLPVSILFSTLIDFLVALAMLGVMLAVCKIPVTIAVLLLPVWMLILLMLATGCGLFASSLMVSYRDVQHILPVLTQFLLYASPVGYAASHVPSQFRFIYDLNPLAGVIEAFRWSLLGVEKPDWAAVIYSADAAIAVLLAGAFAFKKMERAFADVI